MKKQYSKPEVIEVSFALAECVNTGADVDFETSIFNRRPLDEPRVFE